MGDKNQIKIKKVEGPSQREHIKNSLPLSLPIKVLIKNRNKSNGRSCDTKKI